MKLLRLHQIHGVPESVPALIHGGSKPRTAPVPGHPHSNPQGNRKRKAQQVPSRSQSTCQEQPSATSYRTMQEGVTKNIILWVFALGIQQSSETEALSVAGLTGMVSWRKVDKEGVSAVPETGGVSN